jgi:predicted ATPase
MKIIKLDIEGFRSLKSQTWCPGDLNVLIGPNASGKSNLLRVLEMLNAAAKGRLGRYVQHEGGMEPLAWDGVAKEISRAREDDSSSAVHRLRVGRLDVRNRARTTRQVERLSDRSRTSR